jgi:hypothetical protein
VLTGADVLDLQQSNALSSLTTFDNSYAYVDSYSNPCLNRLETCANGITLVVNITVTSSASYAPTDYGFTAGRTVLLSSGGDSAHMPGGFYLHQVNARREQYLEFGLSLNENIYKSQVRVLT